MSWHQGIYQSAATASRKIKEGENPNFSYRCLYEQIMQAFFRPPLMIIPNHVPGEEACRPNGIFRVILYEYSGHVLFFLEVFPAELLAVPNERGRADAKMRNRFQELANAGECAETVIGVCAFGEHVTYYTYDRSSNHIRPSRSELVNGNPPIEWYHNIVEEPGFDTFVTNAIEPLKTVADKLWKEVFGDTKVSSYSDASLSELEKKSMTL